MPTKDFTAKEEQLAVHAYRGNELEYLKQVLESGKLSGLMGGTFTPRFEEKFAAMTGSRYTVAMNTCMSALHAAVLCAKAGAGSEIICDAEFIFGAMAVLYNNAIPVFVDIDPITHNMDPDKIEAAITDRTKAIIVTHAWGLPAETDRIVEIGHRHNLLVIEDCAEAVLASYKGRYTGSWGDIGCFSFQASKQMSLGDGGMATTSSEGLYQELANHAGAPTFKSVAHSLDYNYRINEPTAAIGLAQLEVLPQAIEQLKRNARYYDQAVAGCRWLKLQRGPEGAEHTFYHWVATFSGEEYGIDLSRFKEAVERAGITSITIGYTNMPAYKHPLIENRLAHAFHCSVGGRDYSYENSCPVAERVIPRIVMAYVLGPEEGAKREADKLSSVIRELEG
ncbi:MAG: DegT/DnrJ/EryC1/StrS family aminotransferase [bacterium]|nr:DegT/DnrJ/EryC1/StrS family aminotransferase [bacterium]